MITYPMIILGFFILYLLNSIKILREYERGVIFRLGRYERDLRQNSRGRQLFRNEGQPEMIDDPIDSISGDSWLWEGLARP